MKTTLMGDDQKIHSLFANYLRSKIEDGSIPKGSKLPAIAEFKRIFRLKVGDAFKGLVELEKLGLLKLEEDFSMVTKGTQSDKPNLIDVRKDVDELFSKLKTLEDKAIKLSWERLDRERTRNLFIQNRGSSPSQRIWLMNKAIHAQFVETCGDVKLQARIDVLDAKLEFFRRVYLEPIPNKELLEHAISVDAIVNSIVSHDMENARFHVAAYLEYLREKILAALGYIPFIYWKLDASVPLCSTSRNKEAQIREVSRTLAVETCQLGKKAEEIDAIISTETINIGGDAQSN